MLKVLIACEYSGTVRNAFTNIGHYAMSCDLLDTESPGPHYKGDVLDIINNGWDLMIAHPPCTHLSKAGGWAWKYKAKEQQEAYEFVLNLWNAPIKRICVENPIGWLNSHWQKPSQIVHPYYFGDPWMKETCLWLKNLPLLHYSLTTDLFFEQTAIKPKGNWVKPGNNRPHRRFNEVQEGGKGSAKERARFFPAIAKAMAEQWNY